MARKKEEETTAAQDGVSLNTNDIVQVTGRVLRSRYGTNVAIEHSTVDLQLPDGQLIQTNIRNVEGFRELTEPLTDHSDVVAGLRAQLLESEAALSKAREEVFTLRGDFEATKELLKGAEKRLNEQPKPKAAEKHTEKADSKPAIIDAKGNRK